jgi:hypothetical protein
LGQQKMVRMGNHRNKIKKENESKKMPNLKAHESCSLEKAAFAGPRNEMDGTDGVEIGSFIVVIT